MTWVWIVIAIVVFDVLFTALLLAALIRSSWGPLARKYPPFEPASDAVTRGFQSFRLGRSSFGAAVHVAADERALHLRPARLLRWLGAGGASIPWSEITLVQRGGTGRWAKARIGTTNVVGPAWCLDLAEPGGGPG